MNTLYNTKHSNNQIQQQQDGQSPYYHLQNGYHLSKGQAQSSSPSHKMQNILSSTIAIQQHQQQQNQQQQLQQQQQQKINNSKDTSPLNQTGSFRNGQQKKSFIFQNKYANKNLINNKLNQNNKISQNQKRRKLIDAQNTSNNKANKSINKNYANTPGRQITINTQNQTSILNHSNLLNQGNLTSGNTNNNAKKMFTNKGFTPKNNQQKFRLTKGFTHHSKNQNNEYMQNIYQIIDSVPNSKTTLDQSHNLNNSKHINKTTINNFETADQYQSFNYNNENFLNVQDQQQKQGTKKQLYNITSFKINQAKNNGQPLSTRMQGQNLQLDDIENKAQQYYFPQGIGQSQKSGNYTNRENYLKSFDLKNANHSYRNTSENQNKIHRMAQQQADTTLFNNQSNNNHLNPYQKGKTIPLKNFYNQAQNKQNSELNSLRQTQNLKNNSKEENQAYQNQQQFTQKLQNLNLTQNQNQKQNQNQTPKNQKNLINLKDQKRQTFFENMKKPDLKEMKEGFKKFDFLIKNRPNRGQTTYENINNTNINNYNNNNNNNNNINNNNDSKQQQNNNQQQPVYYDLSQFFYNSSKAQQSSDNNNNYKSENTTRATSNMTQNQSKFTENDHQKNVEDILMNENSMDNFEFGKVLGLGSYAVVRQSVHKPTNQIVAIKTYDKKKLSDPMKLKNVQREIKILSRLRHPNIIRLYQIIETDNQVHLIMELSSQTPLNDFMKTKRSKRVNEEEARLIIKQLAEALKYGHRKCVVHRDIKLENVLIDQNKIVKLVDFGFAVVVPPGHYLNIFCGTPSYMAPEIVNKQDYAFSVDVWALAVMAFKLVSGHFPFKGQSDKELYRKINNCRPEFPSFFTPELKRFIMKIFKQSSNERLQAEDIIKDDWIQGRKSEIDDEFSNPEKMFIERVF